MHRCGSTLILSPSARIASGRADVDALRAAAFFERLCAQIDACRRRTSASRTRRSSSASSPPRLTCASGSAPGREVALRRLAHPERSGVVREVEHEVEAILARRRRRGRSRSRRSLRRRPRRRDATCSGRGRPGSSKSIASSGRRRMQALQRVHRSRSIGFSCCHCASNAPSHPSSAASAPAADRDTPARSAARFPACAPVAQHGHRQPVLQRVRPAQRQLAADRR